MYRYVISAVVDNRVNDGGKLLGLDHSQETFPWNSEFWGPEGSVYNLYKAMKPGPVLLFGFFS